MALICCICLAENVRFYNINKTYLNEFYEKLLNCSVTYKSLSCCYICYALLKKCYKFMLQAVKGNYILAHIKESNLLVTNYKENILSLSVEKLKDTVIDGSTSEFGNEDKAKVFKSHKDSIKIEFEDEIDDVSEDKLDYFSIKQSDDEDDLPLSELQTETALVINEKKDFKVLKKVNTREIRLTIDEQKQEMEQRAKSINYLNSPYKCDLCYRGFIDPTAYGKHRKKHDKSSGPYECEMCHLRYQTERQMKGHYKATHLTKFECCICNVTTHTRNQANQHEEWHKGRTYTCNLCGKVFRKVSSYFTHVRKSHASVHACTFCGDNFVSDYGLRMHISKTHRDIQDSKDEPNMESYCKECDVQFKTVDAWRRHALSNHYSFDTKSSSCPVCNKDVEPEERMAHKRTHTDKHTEEHVYEKTPALATLSCEHCESTFISLHKLRAHMKRVHLGVRYDKNIVCEICGKHCTSLATLKYHQRLHNSKKPFRCDSCGARFPCKENLKIHSRTHSGERPYSCVVCDKKFTQKSALNRHYRVHNGSKPYECQYCSKRFNQSGALKSHVDRIHLKIPRNKKN